MGGLKDKCSYFLETCKLMAKILVNFFWKFFDMVVVGRKDYALMVETLFSKSEKKIKPNFLKNTVSPVNIGDGVV